MQSCNSCPTCSLVPSGLAAAASDIACAPAGLVRLPRCCFGGGMCTAAAGFASSAATAAGGVGADRFPGNAAGLEPSAKFEQRMLK